jgi:hypothetical protein
MYKERITNIDWQWRLVVYNCFTSVKAVHHAMLKRNLLAHGILLALNLYSALNPMQADISETVHVILQQKQWGVFPARLYVWRTDNQPHRIVSINTRACALGTRTLSQVLGT